LIAKEAAGWKANMILWLMKSLQEVSLRHRSKKKKESRRQSQPSEVLAFAFVKYSSCPS
jgi:hypothetical protein